MASLYKKTVQFRDPKTGLMKKRKSRNWWFKYRDENNVIRRKPGFTDKGETQRYAVKLEEQAKLKRAGLSDEFSASATRPLLDHLGEYESFLLAKGTSVAQVKQVGYRCRQIIEGTGSKFPGEVNATKVQKYLASLLSTQPSDRQLKRGGRGAQTCNHYLKAMRQFINWLVRERRLPTNPLISLQQLNVRKDRRHDQRALSLDEMNYVLSAAENGPEIQALSGPDRKVL